MLGGRRGGRGAVALAVALLAAVPALAAPAGAQTAADKAKVDSQIGAARAQVDTASAEEKRLLDQIAASTQRKSELDAKVAGFDGQIAGVQSQLDATQSRLSALEAQQRALEGRLVDARTALAAAKDTLGRQAIAAYTGRTEAAAYAAMLLGATDLGDVASRRSYMRAVVGSQTDTIATTEALRNQIGDLGKQVEASKRQAQGQRDMVAGQRATLQASRDSQAAARQEVQAQIAQTDAARSEALARKAEFEAQVAGLERESAAITAMLRQRAAAQAAAAAAAAARPALPAPGATPRGLSAPLGSPAPLGAVPSRAPGRFLLPVPGAIVTSPFGPRVHPIYGTVRMHTGIDYAAPYGTPIQSGGAGVVISSGWQGDYGIATIIDNGGGLVTLYAHQSGTNVAAGQQVTAGQKIGQVGSTGASTGNHVHFEVRLNGDPVNPLGYL